MRTLSDILEEKIYSAVNYLLALKIKPTLKYGKVTDIDECAFSNCSELTEISLPDSATNIGDMAFFCCTSIKSVTVPLSVNKIGTYAFGYSNSENTAIKIKDFSIKGFTNSAAQTYAQKNGFTFIEKN